MLKSEEKLQVMQNNFRHATNDPICSNTGVFQFREKIADN